MSACQACKWGSYTHAARVQSSYTVQANQPPSNVYQLCLRLHYQLCAQSSTTVATKSNRNHQIKQEKNLVTSARESASHAQQHRTEAPLQARKQRPYNMHESLAAQPILSAACTALTSRHLSAPQRRSLLPRFKSRHCTDLLGYGSKHCLASCTHTHMYAHRLVPHTPTATLTNTACRHIRWRQVPTQR